MKTITNSRGGQTPGKGARLEEERGERGQLHQESRDTCHQPGRGAQPSSRSLLEAVMPRELILVAHS